jgi:hypothetical protein
MEQNLNLNLPGGLAGVLKEISSVSVLGSTSLTIDVIQDMVPTLMFSAAASLLAAAGVSLPPCDLLAPPEDIYMTIDAKTKRLRLECKHTPPHCWDLSGNSTTC